MKGERIIDRLLAYAAEQGLNDNALTRVCGFSVGLISQAKSGKCDLGKRAVEKVLTTFPELSNVWLLTGEGQMLREAPADRDPDELPLIPALAMAGTLTVDTQGLRPCDCEHYRVPSLSSQGAKALITVRGDSMEPTYRSGDLIGICRLTDLTWLEWGRVYVLDTDRGPVLKRLFPGDERGTMRCHSDNTENYPDFYIPLEAVHNIFVVVGSIRIG